MIGLPLPKDLISEYFGQLRITTMLQKITASNHSTGPDDFAIADAPELGRIRQTIVHGLSASERIGMGLRALYNHCLFAQVPAEFKQLLDTLRKREHVSAK